MSSTNKTSHYNLSQYSASDKPTYLVDYNTDMSNIDTGIYNAQTTANSLEANIGTLSDLTTTAKSSTVAAINEVNGKAGDNATAISSLQTATATNTSNIGTMTNLTTTDKSNLVGAINEIVNKFNFSYKQNLTATVSGSTVSINDVNLSSAYNNDGSIGKIYGSLNLKGSGSSGNERVTVTVADTGLRPKTDININGVLFNNYYRSSIGGASSKYSFLQTFTIHTDGTITTELPIWYDQDSTLIFYACLIFATDFGDIPVPPTV